MLKFGDKTRETAKNMDHFSIASVFHPLQQGKKNKDLFGAPIAVAVIFDSRYNCVCVYVYCYVCTNNLFYCLVSGRAYTLPR